MTTDGHNPNVASKNTRRDARELALRMLYQIDIGRQDVEDVLQAALAQSHLDSYFRDFASDVVRGVCGRRDEIDRLLTEHTGEWGVDHSVVDRNILRLAAYEIRFRTASPVAVVCNEAVELAKRYSTDESVGFINGVVRSLARVPRGDDQGASSEAEEGPDDVERETGGESTD
jgi:N utilization substance protein B